MAEEVESIDLKEILEEAKEVTNRQYKWSKTTQRNASKFVRFNLISISVLVAGIPFLVNQTNLKMIDLLNNWTFFGIICMIVGWGLSSYSYAFPLRRFELEREEILEALENELTQEEWYESRLKEYGKVLHNSEEELYFRNLVLAMSQVLFLTSILLFISGIITTEFPSFGYAAVIVFAAVLLITFSLHHFMVERKVIFEQE